MLISKNLILLIKYLLGWLDRNELVDLYLNSDVALVPSLFESFSGSYIEAMYYELPLIVSDLDFAKKYVVKLLFMLLLLMKRVGIFL